MKKLFSAVILTIALMMTTAAFASQTVATLDGTAVTTDTLTNYVNTLLGDKYKNMLDTPQGLKKLAGYYIDRTIILQYAKKNIDKNDQFLKTHQGGNGDMDTQYITTALKINVDDKAMPSSAEVDKEFKKGGYKTRTDAGIKLVEQKRLKAYAVFIKGLRKQHQIKFN